MISPRKLASLPRKTRLRKIVTLFEEFDRLLEQGSLPDRTYVLDVCSLLREEKRIEEGVRALAKRLASDWPPVDRSFADRAPATEPAGSKRTPATEPAASFDELRRSLGHLRFALMDSLGITPADWDFYDPETRSLSRARAGILPLRVFLDDIRSPFNVGSIFRTAEAFGAEGLFVSEYTARPDHQRALRTSMGATEVLPWSMERIEELDPAVSGTVFALEIGGTHIDEFDFPAEGTVIIGSEELGIGPEARAKALGDGGVVSIPLYGAKASLNVAVAFGILMQRWRARISPHESSR